MVVAGEATEAAATASEPVAEAARAATKPAVARTERAGRERVVLGIPHTLSVWSSEPDTMVLPSAEKATELMQSLCALCFSALSSRDAAASVGALRFGIGEVSGGIMYLHPRL